MPTQQAEDGRWDHTFRQSWLKQFEHCPEYARRDYAGEFEFVDSSDTAPGTAVHAVIEACLEAVIAYGHAYSLDVCIDLFNDELDELVENPNFQWTKVKTDAPLRKRGAVMLTNWHSKVLPSLDPKATEISFGPLVLHQDDERIIRVGGTIDYLDHQLGLVDWKTGTRPYERWEYQRWAVQPTVYTWAGHEEQLILPTSVPFEGPGQPEYTFTYYILLPDGEVQVLPITRTPDDWTWLKRKAVGIAKLIELGLDEWPMNDGGWWCSPKWCGAWDDCKGAAYPNGWKQ